MNTLSTKGVSSLYLPYNVPPDTILTENSWNLLFHNGMET